MGSANIPLKEMAKPLNTKAFGPTEKESTQNTPGKKNSIPKSDKKVRSNRQSGIPKPVANRMARRVAFTTGLPTFTGMGVFIASYLVVSRGIADIPPGITLIISASCFLIGLVGLSYGIFSASWEESSGSLLGLENIRPNIKRVRDAFKSPNKPEA